VFAIDHLTWAGQYAVDKKPDVIVHIGDHWDMPSLSHYDKGTKSFEGRRYLSGYCGRNFRNGRGFWLLFGQSSAD